MFLDPHFILPCFHFLLNTCFSILTFCFLIPSFLLRTSHSQVLTFYLSLPTLFFFPSSKYILLTSKLRSYFPFLSIFLLHTSYSSILDSISHFLLITSYFPIPTFHFLLSLPSSLFSLPTFHFIFITSTFILHFQLLFTSHFSKFSIILFSCMYVSPPSSLYPLSVSNFLVLCYYFQVVDARK